MYQWLVGESWEVRMTNPYAIFKSDFPIWINEDLIGHYYHVLCSVKQKKTRTRTAFEHAMVAINSPISCDHSSKHPWSFTKFIQVYIRMIMKHCRRCRHSRLRLILLTFAATATTRVNWWQQVLLLLFSHTASLHHLHWNVKCYTTVSYSPFPHPRFVFPLDIAGCSVTVIIVSLDYFVFHYYFDVSIPCKLHNLAFYSSAITTTTTTTLLLILRQWK